MKFLKILSIAVLAAAVFVALAAPIGPMPGFFIGGESTPAPTTWPDTSNVHEIKLKVPGTLPRVVTIWVVDHESELHVVGSRESGWVMMIGEGSPVEMRIENQTYALNAIAVTDGWQAVLEDYVAKYQPDYPEIIAGFPKVEEAGDSVAVYRLSRGPAGSR
jgi:hypothetical protein